MLGMKNEKSRANTKMSEGNGIVETMENKIVFEVHRTEVSSMVGRELTDREWEVMASEIESFLEHYTSIDVPILFGDIDSLVAEDDEYNESK